MSWKTLTNKRLDEIWAQLLLVREAASKTLRTVETDKTIIRSLETELAFLQKQNTQLIGMLGAPAITTSQPIPEIPLPDDLDVGDLFTPGVRSSNDPIGDEE